MTSLLTASTIGLLGEGRAGDHIDQALQIATRDTDARGADEKPRKVIITIDLLKTEDGSISIGCEVEVKAPRLRVQRTLGDLRWEGKGQALSFDSESQEEEAA